MEVKSMAIETPRLILRQFSIEDSSLLYQIMGDSEVMRYWASGPDKTVEQTRERIESMLQEWRANEFGDWAVIKKEDNTLIGFCGLHHISNMPEVNLGFVLDKATWGKGYATEAALASLSFGFEKCHLSQIVGVTDPDNLATRRVLEKCGLRFWKDIIRKERSRVVYSVSKAEWKQSK